MDKNDIEIIDDFIETIDQWSGVFTGIKIIIDGDFDNVLFELNDLSKKIWDIVDINKIADITKDEDLLKSVANRVDDAIEELDSTIFNAETKAKDNGDKDVFINARDLADYFDILSDMSDMWEDYKKENI